MSSSHTFISFIIMFIIIISFSFLFSCIFYQSYVCSFTIFFSLKPMFVYTFSLFLRSVEFMQYLYLIFLLIVFYHNYLYTKLWPCPLCGWFYLGWDFSDLNDLLCCTLVWNEVYGLCALRTKQLLQCCGVHAVVLCEWCLPEQSLAVLRESLRV